MAIVSIPPIQLFSPFVDSMDVNAITLDATGESVSVIGRLWIEGTPGGTKVLSAGGGGSIFTRMSAVTLANGSSVFDIGIQDVSTSTGLEDGTFDVSGSWVSAAAPTANIWNKKVMDTGTKTMAHGDLIAIVANFTTRAGADSLSFRRFASQTQTMAFPYGSADTGTLAKATTALMAMIVFDDGTRGWIHGFTLPASSNTSISFHVSSALDEYCNIFTPTATMQISAIAQCVFNVVAGDTYEIILYEDPMGARTFLETVTPDPDVNSSTNATSYDWQLITPVTLAAGVTYGVSARPLTVNPISFGHSTLNVTDNEVLKAMNPWGMSAKVVAATNLGAFAEVQTYFVPLFGVLVTGLDDGAGGGGGMLRHVGMSGGLNA